MTTLIHEEELDPHVARWVLRVLLDAGAGRRMLKRTGTLGEELLSAVGLDGLADQKLESAAVLRLLKERQETLESEPAPKKGLLFRNARRLGDALKLTRVERELLVFAVASELSGPLHDCLDKVRARTVPEIAAALAKVLRRPVRELLAALRRDGALLSGGLITLSEPERHGCCPLEPMNGLAMLLLSEHTSPDALVAPFFRPSRPTPLTLEDFPHVRADLEVVRPLLKTALDRRTQGVNVLVYGAPGTGKSELARVLAREVDAALYEVCDEDTDGDPIRGARRFSAYLLAQRVMRERSRALVLFDEVEDVFDVPADEARAKAWTNRALEQNPVPAFWITNSISEIDPAFLRRFDYLLELRAPPVAVRERILADRMRAHSPRAEWIHRSAADERLTPAQADRAARVVDLALANATQGVGAETIATRFLENALAVQASASARGPDLGAGARYDLAYVNASLSPARLCDALRASPRGTICLYGPPGTGKTAFVQHVARTLGKPLILKRASDLLSCWVGGTEHNIAMMFRDARREGAVLLLDEADSFLADRRGATRSWEVTQVNELLVQMEAFDGLFFCATNLFETLDAASLRRFSLKVRFEPPTAAQRFGLFEETLRTLGVALTESDRPLLRAQLDALNGVTPGDFRTVIRQARMLKTLTTPDAIVDALAQELRARPEARRGHVGFHPQRASTATPELTSLPARASER